MLGRTRRKRGAHWRRALALSFALHGLALLAVGLGTGARAWVPDGSPAFLPMVAIDDTQTIVDVALADTAMPSEMMEGHAVVSPAPEPPTGAEADRTNQVPESRPHPFDGVAAGAAPAPDRGGGPGRPVDDAAWKRDASTLHERLTDGANVNQPSRARTGRALASPQAVRRERTTGVGDSMRTSRAAGAPLASRYGVSEPDEPGVGDDTVEASAEAVHAVALMQPVVNPDVAPARGPLDADRGTRSFDVDAPGPIAVDNRVQRAASNEAKPSITDVTLSAVSGHGSEGRGPSDTPGVVAHPTAGAAPALQGARNVTPGLNDEQRTQERAYDRYQQEIKARFFRMLVFPRALALRLEQGETILRFVVRPDGKVGDDVQVIKSSGFEEFDQAALGALRRAAPFPPMSNPGKARPLAVKLSVPFSNPLIR